MARISLYLQLARLYVDGYKLQHAIMILEYAFDLGELIEFIVEKAQG